MTRTFSIFSTLLLLSLNAGAQESLLVETEHFDNYGGWVMDEQFHETVGSPYMLAHGAGTPVADATTTVTLPSEGTYHVWVRTYNWNAPWDSAQAPGVFQLLVNGKAVCKKLGDVPTTWDWQYAGKVRAGRKSLKLALHDLTGFEGRCDAIYFSKSENPVFPTERRTLTVSDSGSYDLIVAGGGLSGISAAVAAARLGIKVLLLDNKAHIGGNGAPEIHIGASGRIHGGKYPKLGNVLAEYGNAYTNYDTFISKLRAEANLTVLLSHRVIAVEKDGNRIKSVTAADYENRRNVVFKAAYFADCTGDANLGVLAGAEYMTGQETRDVYGETLAPEKPDSRSYGSTVRWTSVESEGAVGYPETPWAVQFTDSTMRAVRKGAWNWEVGFKNDQINDAEYLRDYMFRVIYGNWSHIKRSDSTRVQFANLTLNGKSVQYILGKRESRRLKGDYVFTQDDCYGRWTELPDAAVWCTYPIDQHFPTLRSAREFPGGEFESAMQHNFMPLGVPRRKLVVGRDYNYPYHLPYRCFYSVNVENMFMAGRNISGSRLALCSYRVAGSGALMGEVVGIAAVLCAKYSCTPRELYTDHLDELLKALSRGVPQKYEFIYSPT